MNEPLLKQINRLQKIGLALAGLGLACCLWGAFFSPPQFFRAYLFSYLFWLELSLGCFAVAMIHYLTGGRWGDVTRRFLEAGFMTLPGMAILFTPIIFGAKFLYPWDQPAIVAASSILQSQRSYMNPGAFTVRAIFFFSVWIFMAIRLRQWSRQQDETTNPAPTRRLRTLSGPGIIVYALTVTLASVDWMMSLEPDWHSTMSPLIICIGQILAAYALAIVMLAWFRKYEPWSQMDIVVPFHHLGNLLLAFVMFWTYVSFGQWLIVWSGNLPSEIGWYQHRIAGDWKAIVIFLAVFNFSLPFSLLLFRVSKRHVAVLSWIAGIVLVSQIVNTFWLVAPAFYPGGMQVNWMDFAALVGVGGFWITAFSVALKRAPLVARNDPRMQFFIAQAYEPKLSQ